MLNNRIESGKNSLLKRLSDPSAGSLRWRRTQLRCRSNMLKDASDSFVLHTINYNNQLDKNNKNDLLLNSSKCLWKSFELTVWRKIGSLRNNLRIETCRLKKLKTFKICELNSFELFYKRNSSRKLLSECWWGLFWGALLAEI